MHIVVRNRAVWEPHERADISTCKPNDQRAGSFESPATSDEGWRIAREIAFRMDDHLDRWNSAARYQYRLEFERTRESKHGLPARVDLSPSTLAKGGSSSVRYDLLAISPKYFRYYIIIAH